MSSFVLRRSLPSVSGLVALLFAVGFAAVYYLGMPLWFPAAFAVVMLLVQYLVNPWIVQWLVPAEIVADKKFATDHPVVELVARRCAEARVPMVKLGIVDDGTPNAFTFGRTTKDARIWLTRGLLERLDERELDAVVAHEVGHIKNRDFIVMTVAAVIPMVLYLVYVMARESRRRESVPVAVGAYAGYVLAQLALLALSRARETAADNWSCRCTQDGDALASALVKVAYGMGVAQAEGRERAYALQEQGKEARKALAAQTRRNRRAESMRAMGIFEPRHAEAMAAAFAGGIDPERAVAAMRWDMTNPWATTLEKLASHPLVAHRIEALEQSGLPGAPTTWSVLRSSARPDSATKAVARARFVTELAVMVAPYAVLVPLLAFGAFTGSLLSTGIALAAGGALLFYKQTVRYPSHWEPVEEVASLLERMDASPMSGIPVSVAGRVIGRGMPGYVLSPDLVIADASGFVPLVYRQPIPFAATLFGLFRAGDFIGDDVVARGWYRRGPGPMIELRDVQRADGGRRRARTWWWAAAYAVSVGLIVAGVFVALAGATG
jgi:Zn-dependent protease with chaperone function